MPRVTRDKLYAQVWNTPMSRLAAEYGISGNGLAKICRRLEIPYPPRGYWAKKAAGKPVVEYKLPPQTEGNLDWVDISPTSKAESRPAEAVKAVETIRSQIAEIKIPDTMRNLHPKVRDWIDQHARKQKEIEQDRRKHARDQWFWSPKSLRDLTERDKYRFRVTSALLIAVEKGGGKVLEADIRGRLTLSVEGEEVECVVTEKMTRMLSGSQERDTEWTAYPDFHNSGLRPTGYLRLEIKTYLSGDVRPWVETDKKSASAILPEIVAEIIAAGPALANERLVREEQRRKWAEQEEARRENSTAKGD